MGKQGSGGGVPLPPPTQKLVDGLRAAGRNDAVSKLKNTQQIPKLEVPSKTLLQELRQADSISWSKCCRT